MPVLARRRCRDERLSVRGGDRRDRSALVNLFAKTGPACQQNPR